MRALFTVKLLLFSGLLLFCTPLHGGEPRGSKNFIAAGIGIEQLTYKEQVRDIELTSSANDLINWVLYLEARKVWQNFFIGVRGQIPLSDDEVRESWTRGGEFEQTNSLAYQWTRAEAHVGYFLHPLLNPYAGVQWSYAQQERSDFENVATPGIFNESATEELYACAALLGIQGEIPFADSWSFSFSAEYMLPFYSNITNDALPGWEASNINGYSYAVTGRLNYAFAETVSAVLQIKGGRRHWEGSDWIQAGGTQAKWPENDTDFLGGFISICKYF